ncbi:MAG: hypothetical protein WCD33_19265 [Mycobacterium sp.]|uniref:hypothetical protein n=1 Tax=Mycobacterium sp. TaxID=1785 RepID=UPI003C76968E
MPVADDENALALADVAETGGRPQALAEYGAENGHLRAPGDARHGRAFFGRTRLLWIGGYLAAGLLLFLCCLRFSGTVGVTADGGLTLALLAKAQPGDRVVVACGLEPHRYWIACPQPAQVPVLPVISF